MKTILSFFVTCFTAISVFAQSSSTLTINVRGADNERVIVDSKSYDIRNDINNSGVNTPVSITDLQPGQHTLQIIRTGEVNNTGNTTVFYLRSGYDLSINIAANGSVQQRETKWTSNNTGAYGVPMTDANFNVLYRSVLNQNQANTKLSLVNNAFANTSNYFTVAQAKQLIELIYSQSSRLSLAKASYRSITDPANFTQLYSLLNSTAYRNDLAAYVSDYNANNSGNTTAMTTNRFNNFYRAAQRQTTTSAKVSYILGIFSNTNNYYTVAQARQLIQLVSGETNRLYLAKQSYRGITNPANFSRIHELLSSQSSRNELTRFVNSFDGNNAGILQTAMSDADFNTLYRSVENRWGLGAKMSALTDIFNKESNFFTVVQSKQLIQLVSSEPNRLQLAKSAYNNVVDPANFSQLYDLLASQSSRTELDTYVRNNYNYNGSTVYTTEKIPMTDANFNVIYNDVSNRWGLGAKMSALTDIFNNENNYFTVAQAKQLIQLVSDEDNRLQLAKSSYNNITDPQNFSLMYDVLASQTKRNELAAYVNTYSYNR
ncbi:MAG: DUF4476 domain-containing protein [Bacteroidetes bacterium]|nr:MAG: DUF4476 domain-containing protein [Bacteroidota bacterium]